MTWKQKHRENEKFIKLYTNYLPLVSNIKSRLKLVMEIYRLCKQNEQIEHMIVVKYRSDTNDYFVEHNSILCSTP